MHWLYQRTQEEEVKLEVTFLGLEEPGMSELYLVRMQKIGQARVLSSGERERRADSN